MDNEKVPESMLGAIAIFLFAGAAWIAYPGLVVLFQNQSIKSNVAAVIGSGTGTATLTWNANTEPDLASYKIYYGTSPRTGTNPKVCGMCGYTASVNAGNVTSYAFSGMTNGQTYYFSTSALDTSNNESTFSGEVHKSIPAVTSSPTDNTPPTSNTPPPVSNTPPPDTTSQTVLPTGSTLSPLSNLSATAKGSSQVSISWNPSTNAVVGYYLYRNGYQIANTSLTSYTDTVSPGGMYAYTVKAYDTHGNVSPLSSAITVTVAAPPTSTTGTTQTTTTATEKNTFSFTSNLKLTQTHSDVKALQQFLNARGFTVASAGSGAPGSETTYFGAKTYTALVKFQKSVGLPATGYFGPMTRAKISTF